MLIDSDANNETDDQHAIAYALLRDVVFKLDGITVNATKDIVPHINKPDFDGHEAVDFIPSASIHTPGCTVIRPAAPFLMEARLPWSRIRRGVMRWSADQRFKLGGSPE